MSKPDHFVMTASMKTDRKNSTSRLTCGKRARTGILSLMHHRERIMSPELGRWVEKVLRERASPIEMMDDVLRVRAGWHARNWHGFRAPAA